MLLSILCVTYAVALLGYAVSAAGPEVRGAGPEPGAVQRRVRGGRHLHRLEDRGVVAESARAHGDYAGTE